MITVVLKTAVSYKDLVRLPEHDEWVYEPVIYDCSSIHEGTECRVEYTEYGARCPGRLVTRTGSTLICFHCYPKEMKELEKCSRYLKKAASERRSSAITEALHAKMRKQWGIEEI